MYAFGKVKFFSRNRGYGFAEIDPKSPFLRNIDENSPFHGLGPDEEVCFHEDRQTKFDVSKSQPIFSQDLVGERPSLKKDDVIVFFPSTVKEEGKRRRVLAWNSSSNYLEALRAIQDRQKHEAKHSANVNASSQAIELANSAS